ncbi:FkbM family methyltransferase [Spirosoma sp. KUDC1026]|uniref:FkbM family methyltransferase n=1 Tax=Spirosoma sp. KUDC1026 TaxID=2745947 RepID=UPI00159B894F|nr:FkbM family methyltransferase [Spirosoma sp. KUDC1026]QKZ11538.1 FkbM family methyltransferase [Spirosoma sp. KUDC1026]
MKFTKYLDDALFLLANPRLIRWVPHGLQIQPNRAYRAPWIHDLHINTILDIGANVGQAAINFCTLFPAAVVHSFEPIPDCFAQLKKVATAFPALSVHNFALGNETGQIDFHQNAYSPASSILPMSDEHIKSYPKTIESSTISVPIRRLDDIAAELNLSKQTRMLVKIDVQGYEKNVIAGGNNVIRSASIVVVETSIKSLYEGDSSFRDLYQLLSDLGFDYHGSLEQLIDPKTGAVLQQDAVFVKK